MKNYRITFKKDFDGTKKRVTRFANGAIDLFDKLDIINKDVSIELDTLVIETKDIEQINPSEQAI